MNKGLSLVSFACNIGLHDCGTLANSLLPKYTILQNIMTGLPVAYSQFISQIDTKRCAFKLLIHFPEQIHYALIDIGVYTDNAGFLWVFISVRFGLHRFNI